VSAGAVVWRRGAAGVEIVIVHPGGPFFANKDLGAWSIPKGEIDRPEGETPDVDSGNIPETLLEAAARELLEETGLAPDGAWVPLGETRQKSGKVVHAFAIEADAPLPKAHQPPQIRIEYPPGSMHELAFPEVDRVCFASLDEARARLNPAQVVFVERLEAWLAG
jgi:predicted NUDIX family NTP pyrophosphohydrolase